MEMNPNGWQAAQAHNKALMASTAPGASSFGIHASRSAEAQKVGGKPESWRKNMIPIEQTW